MRGHGKSEKPEGPYSIEQFADDILDILSGLGISEAHFIGLSMGGSILQYLALSYPQMVKSMILMSSFCYVDPSLKDKLIKLRKSLVEGGFGSFFDEILPMVLIPQFIEENKDLLMDIKEEKIKTESEEVLINSIDACLNFNLKNEISSIETPVLIISGKEDRFVPVYLAEEIHESINNSSIEIIKKTSHNVLIPQNVPLILEMINKFFRKNQSLI